MTVVGDDNVEETTEVEDEMEDAIRGGPEEVGGAEEEANSEA
jgi:hypothetical protein